MQASASLKHADKDMRHPVKHHGPQHTAHSQAIEVLMRSAGATKDNHSKVCHHC